MTDRRPDEPLYREWAGDFEPLPEARRIVYVHEHVVEPGPMPGSGRLKFAPGEWITVDEARAFGVPLVDDQHQPVHEDGVGAVETQAVGEADVETQDVKPPKPTARLKTPKTEPKAK